MPVHVSGSRTVNSPRFKAVNALSTCFWSSVSLSRAAGGIILILLFQQIGHVACQVMSSFYQTRLVNTLNKLSNCKVLETGSCKLHSPVSSKFPANKENRFF